MPIRRRGDTVAAGSGFWREQWPNCLSECFDLRVEDAQARVHTVEALDELRVAVPLVRFGARGFERATLDQLGRGGLALLQVRDQLDEQGALLASGAPEPGKVEWRWRGGQLHAQILRAKR